MINFAPNCTLPPAETPHFVSSAGVRGTFDIIWSCFSIIILSVWSIHHPEVPLPSITSNKTQTLRKEGDLLLSQIKFTLKMIGTPEIFVLGAIYQNYKLWMMRNDIRAQAVDEEEKQLCMRQIFLAELDGIAVVFPERMNDSNDTTEAPIQANTQEVSEDQAQPARRDFQRDDGSASLSAQREAPTHVNARNASDGQAQPAHQDLQPGDSSPSLSATEDVSNVTYPSSGTTGTSREMDDLSRHMELYAMYKDWQAEKHGNSGWKINPTNKDLVSACNGDIPVHKLVRFQGSFWVLDTRQLLLCKRFGIVDSMTKLTSNQVADIDRGSMLINLLAIAQILWLAVDLSARAYFGLPLSQLEILTMAYAAVSVLMYLLYIPVPHNVRYVTFISAKRFATVEELQDIADPDRIERSRSRFVGPLPVSGWIIAYAIFGGINLLAIGTQFPTHIEKLLWITSSSVSIGTQIVFYGLASLVMLYTEWQHTTPKWWLDLGQTIEALSRFSRPMSTLLYIIRWIFYPPGIGLCVILRTFLFVEAFRALFYLPPKAFIATWTANSPHLG